MTELWQYLVVIIAFLWGVSSAAIWEQRNINKAAPREIGKRMMATDKKLSWTQPVCVACWGGIKVKTGRAADAGQVLEQELCCFCNAALQGGRYQIRINPATVPYPTRK